MFEAVCGKCHKKAALEDSCKCAAIQPEAMHNGPNVVLLADISLLCYSTISDWMACQKEHNMMTLHMRSSAHCSRHGHPRYGHSHQSMVCWARMQQYSVVLQHFWHHFYYAPASRKLIHKWLSESVSINGPTQDMGCNAVEADVCTLQRFSLVVSKLQGFLWGAKCWFRLSSCTRVVFFTIVLEWKMSWK